MLATEIWGLSQIYPKMLRPARLSRTCPLLAFKSELYASLRYLLIITVTALSPSTRRTPWGRRAAPELASATSATPCEAAARPGGLMLFCLLQDVLQCLRCCRHSSLSRFPTTRQEFPIGISELNFPLPPACLVFSGARHCLQGRR